MKNKSQFSVVMGVLCAFLFATSGYAKPLPQETKPVQKPNVTVTVTYNPIEPKQPEPTTEDTPEAGAQTPQEVLSLPVDPTLNERELRTRYMGIELTRHLYRSAQWELLGTPEDTAYTHFFYSLNSVLGGLFDKVKAIHDMQLEEASGQFRTGKVPLSPGYTPYVNRIYRTAQELARAEGFPAAAIQNIELFSQDGEMNAYTISGNHNRIIINLFTTLLNRLSVGEWSGVLGHELGHIRLLHSVKGIMHNIFMTMVMRSYASPKYLESLGELRGLFAPKGCHNAGCSHNHVNTVEDSLVQNNLDSQLNNVVVEGVKLLSQLPKQARDLIIKEYIVLMLRSLKAETGSPVAIQVLSEVLRSKPSFSQETNGEKLMFALNDAQMAISRGQERSADRISTSVVPNEYLGNAMVKLGGPPMDPSITDPRKKREELERLRQMIVDNMAITNEKFKGQDRSSQVGSTHPAIGFRVDEILKLATFPEIVFADPMLANMLLEDQLQTAVWSQKPGAAELLPLLRRDLVVLIESFGGQGLSRKVNPRFDKAIQYAAYNRAAALKVLEALTTAPKADENTNQGIQFIAAELDNSLELFRMLDARLAGLTPANKDEKANIAKRRKMIKNLLEADTYEKVVAVHVSARPAHAENPVRARRLLPITQQVPVNPDRKYICSFLLSKSAELQNK